MNRASNHDRFAAVFRKHAGRTFTMKEIFRIMTEESDIEPGSVQPSFHTAPNKKAPRCPCAGTPQQIFLHVGPARYKVRRFRRAKP